MKLIGKQIVVELPEEKYKFTGLNANDVGCQYCEREIHQCKCFQVYNLALSEVAKMNPALEVDEAMLNKITFGLACGIQAVYDLEIATVPDVEKMIKDALTFNPSAWLKRKE